MSLLEVTDLCVGFHMPGRDVQVVDKVSFTLEEGQTLAIVGESGSGKTQTAFSIVGLLADNGYSWGSVKFEGKELIGLRESELNKVRAEKIAMIFQDPMTSLNPYIRVIDQLAEVLVQHKGVSRQQAEAESIRMLDAVKLPDGKNIARRFPHECSGGMRQRIMIAMALLCRPKLLIADEPTTALDVTVQAQIMALLAELREELGMAMIFITHDIGLVAGIADEIMVMQHGVAVEQGSLDAVLDNPQHDYTRHLLNAVPHFTFGNTVRDDGTRSGQPPIVTVDNLAVRFPVTRGLFRTRTGAVHAVDGVDFDLVPGETLAIVGESGSGKSTTARAILGLVQATRGRIDAKSGRSGRPVQMVFQDPYASLNPRLNVEGLLAEPAIAAGQRVDAKLRERMVTLLERVGLSRDALTRYPHQFSGGQRQRLCIARALMLNPDVVVLDEAVSALDVSVQARVLDLLIDLQREFGLAYLFISHDMAVVERIAHRIAVMYAGQIVEIGKAAAVLATPQHSYTRRLIAAVPAVARRRQRFTVDATQVPSLVRPVGYEPPPAQWREAGDDHRVRVEETA